MEASQKYETTAPIAVKKTDLNKLLKGRSKKPEQPRAPLKTPKQQYEENLLLGKNDVLQAEKAKAKAKAQKLAAEAAAAEAAVASAAAAAAAAAAETERLLAEGQKPKGPMKRAGSAAGNNQASKKIPEPAPDSDLLVEDNIRSGAQTSNVELPVHLITLQKLTLNMVSSTGFEKNITKKYQSKFQTDKDWTNLTPWEEDFLPNLLTHTIDGNEYSLTLGDQVGDSRGKGHVKFDKNQYIGRYKMQLKTTDGSHNFVFNPISDTVLRDLASTTIEVPPIFYKLSEENKKYVIRITKLLQGMPSAQPFRVIATEIFASLKAHSMGIGPEIYAAGVFSVPKTRTTETQTEQQLYCSIVVMQDGGATLLNWLDTMGGLNGNGGEPLVNVAHQCFQICLLLGKYLIANLDIKPGNMLVDSRQKVTLIDFDGIHYKDYSVMPQEVQETMGTPEAFALANIVLLTAQIKQGLSNTTISDAFVQAIQNKMTRLANTVVLKQSVEIVPGNKWLLQSTLPTLFDLGHVRAPYSENDQLQHAFEKMVNWYFIYTERYLKLLKAVYMTRGRSWSIRSEGRFNQLRMIDNPYYLNPDHPAAKWLLSKDSNDKMFYVDKIDQAANAAEYQPGAGTLADLSGALVNNTAIPTEEVHVQLRTYIANNPAHALLMGRIASKANSTFSQYTRMWIATNGATPEPTLIKQMIRFAIFHRRSQQPQVSYSNTSMNAVLEKIIGTELMQLQPLSLSELHRLLWES